MNNHLVDIQHFYEMMAQLKEKCRDKRKLAACHGRMDWPQRGVYFFYEDGESRSTSGSGPRVVRVGTHALKAGGKTTLWNRLKAHKGAQDGGGNHRGSIFRLHVGSALAVRDAWAHNITAQWETGANAPREVREIEHPLEQAVSRHICAMPFLWLAVNDAPGPNSLRGFIERNSIGLLSNCNSDPIDPPSMNWLGRYAQREVIRNSGLWNVNHVHEGYDPDFLGILQDLIQKMQPAA